MSVSIGLGVSRGMRAGLFVSFLGAGWHPCCTVYIWTNFLLFAAKENSFFTNTIIKKGNGPLKQKHTPPLIHTSLHGAPKKLTCVFLNV